MAVDIPIPPPCTRNGLGVPALEPLRLSSPGSLSLSDGDQERFCVPTSNAQAPVACDPGTNRVAGPKQRKRRRDDTDLDDEDSQNTTVQRNVRPRRDKRNNAPPGPAGSSGPSAPANHSRSHPFTTDGTTPHGGPSSNGSSNSPDTSAIPLAPRLDPSLRPVQGHQSSAQPVEANDTVLRAANPRSGPVSGGIEIWLEMEHLPTAFTLYAKFGDKVAATVSSTSHPFSQSSSNLHISRFGISVR